jgi:single-strand DNA-binding protein
MNTATEATSDDNQIRLRGRLAVLATSRTMPSGDQLCSFRVTVARPPGGRVLVDTIACSTTRARVRRTIERCQPGERVEISGSLHRRFWRTPTGPTSRYEVDVSSARLISRRQTSASPSQKPVSA